MADVPAVSYITAAEVKSQTLLATLKNLAEADVEQLIEIAEDQIDAYVGPQAHHQDDTNTDRVFPREQDCDASGNPVIPYRVSRATLRQVEWLYSQWWPSRTTMELPVMYPISSRDIGGDGSYSETLARGGINLSEASLSEQAKLLLNGFVSRMVGISVTDPDTVPDAT